MQRYPYKSQAFNGSVVFSGPRVFSCIHAYHLYEACVYTRRGALAEGVPRTKCMPTRE